MWSVKNVEKRAGAVSEVDEAYGAGGVQGSRRARAGDTRIEFGKLSEK